MLFIYLYSYAIYLLKYQKDLLVIFIHVFLFHLDFKKILPIFKIKKRLLFSSLV